MKQKLIESYNLTKRENSDKELYDGSGVFYSETLIDFYEESAWGDGFRTVLIKFDERLIFTYCEGDLTLSVCNSSAEFYRELYEASEFYLTN